jgi:hypothetical protein
MTTFAPSLAKLTAIARPIPELAPVTTAVFPASKLDIGQTLSRIRSTRGVILPAEPDGSPPAEWYQRRSSSGDRAVSAVIVLV